MADPIIMTFWIPFLFVFAITFGVFEKTKILPNKGVLAVVSGVLAFFAASYQPFVTLLNQNMMNLVMFFIAMFFLIFFMEILGVKPGSQKAPSGVMQDIVIHSVVLFILIAIGFNYIESTNISLPFITNDNLMLAIGIIVIIAIFWSFFKISPMLEHIQRVEEEAKQKQKG